MRRSSIIQSMYKATVTILSTLMVLRFFTYVGFLQLIICIFSMKLLVCAWICNRHPRCFVENAASGESYSFCVRFAFFGIVTLLERSGLAMTHEAVIFQTNDSHNSPTCMILLDCKVSVTIHCSCSTLTRNVSHIQGRYLIWYAQSSLLVTFWTRVSKFSIQQLRLERRVAARCLYLHEFVAC